MIEQLKPKEIIVTEQDVIEALNGTGIENPETKDLLTKYVDQCHAEADLKAQANPDLSNQANIEAELKIVELYSKTKYKDYAYDSLMSLYEASIQNDLTKDLVERINLLLKSL